MLAKRRKRRSVQVRWECEACRLSQPLRGRDIHNVVTARESNSDRLVLLLSGSGAATEASTAARTFGEAQWLADDELARLCIIIEELVANLYDHGGVTKDHEVELQLESEPGG